MQQSATITATHHDHPHNEWCDSHHVSGDVLSHFGPDARIGSTIRLQLERSTVSNPDSEHVDMHQTAPRIFVDAAGESILTLDEAERLHSELGTLIRQGRLPEIPADEPRIEQEGIGCPRWCINADTDHPDQHESVQQVVRLVGEASRALFVEVTQPAPSGTAVPRSVVDRSQFASIEVAQDDDLLTVIPAAAARSLAAALVRAADVAEGAHPA